MFVSSYNTYIDTGTTKRAQDERSESLKKPSSTFESKLLATNSSEVLLDKKLPLNYISNYKALNNRQKLEHQELTQNPAKMKFSKLTAMSSASSAYAENTKMFSLIQKPKQTINQTPKLDSNLPKVQMINAYISNDNYHRITAA